MASLSTGDILNISVAGIAAAASIVTVVLMQRYRKQDKKQKNEDIIHALAAALKNTRQVASDSFLYFRYTKWQEPRAKSANERHLAELRKSVGDLNNAVERYSTRLPEVLSAGLTQELRQWTSKIKTAEGFLPPHTEQVDDEAVNARVKKIAEGYEYFNGKLASEVDRILEGLHSLLPTKQDARQRK